jgi:hypothetical protein
MSVKEIADFIDAMTKDPELFKTVKDYVDWVVGDTVGALIRHGVPGYAIFIALGWIVK